MIGTVARAEEEPAFPTPWAARAFALASGAQERGLFSGLEWAEALGAAIADEPPAATDDSEAYWRAWLAALETLLAEKRLAAPGDLAELREAWRRAAEATPHGRPVELIR